MNMQYIFIFALLFSLFGCNSIQTRIENAESISTQNNFHKKVIQTKLFKLISYQKLSRTSEIAVVYIEGDGLAWKNKYKVSQNPTPNNPIALELATLDSSPLIIYLARPCQFINLDNEVNCQHQYWTNKRASIEVIESIDSAISEIKKQLKIKKIRLVGYSGGATIAAIIAATRDDIIDLRTVAGNLDIDKFVETHNVTPLTGSVNPTTYSQKLVEIPQTHFISENDAVISKTITNSYLKSLEKFDDKLNCVKLIELSTPEHTKGWANVWKNQNHQIQKCYNSINH